MYGTADGERILRGAERELFVTSLGMMVDHLSQGDCEFGSRVFDNLQYGQKLFALYRVARALLIPDEPAPEHTAFAESAVASVYEYAASMIEVEIQDPELSSGPSFRELVLDAARANGNLDAFPNSRSSNVENWEEFVRLLADTVLRDRDFEFEGHLDADPERSEQVKEFMGIGKGYYTAIPTEPPDEQLNLYLDALKGLTPSGRAADFKDVSESDGDELF